MRDLTDVLLTAEKGPLHISAVCRPGEVLLRQVVVMVCLHRRGSQPEHRKGSHVFPALISM